MNNVGTISPCPIGSVACFTATATVSTRWVHGPNCPSPIRRTPTPPEYDDMDNWHAEYVTAVGARAPARGDARGLEGAAARRGELRLISPRKAVDLLKQRPMKG